MAIIERVARVFSSLSNLGLAACYLLTWAGVPLVGGDSVVRPLAYVIVVEFVLQLFTMPLAALLVGPARKSIKEDVAHHKSYVPILGAISVAMVSAGLYYSAKADAIWPMINVARFLAVSVNLYFHPPRRRLEANQIMAGPALRVMLLFFLLWLCVLIPIPSWGVPSEMSGFGAFPPAGIMVWGALYFGLIGLYGHRWEAVMVASAHWKD